MISNNPAHIRRFAETAGGETIFKTLTATAFYYLDAKILSQIASLLGREDDAKTYAALADDIRSTFNSSFYHADTHRYATGSQTANAIPLVFGLAPESDRPAIVLRRG